LDAVRTWRKAAGSFHGIKVSLPLWDALNEAVENWNLMAQEKLAPIKIGHRIAVLDTSALMEHPEILQRQSSSDILVVPLRVLSELDGLKSSEDETRAVKAREAIRQLNANLSVSIMRKTTQLYYLQSGMLGSQTMPFFQRRYSFG
jgi:uncharacterized protein YacL